MAEKEIGARARLKKVEGTVKTMPLSKFLKSIDPKCRLSKRDRLRIVDQALLLLEMNYVHLPLKRAMHAIDPIQRLKLLKFRLMESEEGELQSGMQFHKRMLEIFASSRDLHTMYLLPTPFKDQVAFLPFLVEQYFDQKPASSGAGTRARPKKRAGMNSSKVVVAEHIQCTPNPGPEVVCFEPGVEVLYWNGVPIDRVIEINGEMQSGSNLEARFARGLDNLTSRPLDLSLPPDEDWVTLTYRSKNGKN